MRCPICDKKPMNCDCTPRERAMWREMQERGDAPQTPSLTDAERRDIKVAADAYAYADHDPDCERIAATLRGLLERLK